jgi:hypothetical protein
MASDDYYTHLARTQLERLEAGKAQALADLQAAKANADYESAGAAVQQIADLEVQKANILNLHSQYVRSPAGPSRAAGIISRGKARQAMGQNDLAGRARSRQDLEIRQRPEF